MTLHQELLNNDIKCENYATDLLFPKTPKSVEILKKYPLQNKIAMGFKSETDGLIYIEVPFNFEKGLVKNV